MHACWKEQDKLGFCQKITAAVESDRIRSGQSATNAAAAKTVLKIRRPSVALVG